MIKISLRLSNQFKLTNRLTPAHFNLTQPAVTNDHSFEEIQTIIHNTPLTDRSHEEVINSPIHYSSRNIAMAMTNVVPRGKEKEKGSIAITPKLGVMTNAIISNGSLTTMSMDLNTIVRHKISHAELQLVKNRLFKIYNSDKLRHNLYINCQVNIAVKGDYVGRCGEVLLKILKPHLDKNNLNISNIYIHNSVTSRSIDFMVFPIDFYLIPSDILRNSTIEYSNELSIDDNSTTNKSETSIDESNKTNTISDKKNHIITNYLNNVENFINNDLFNQKVNSPVNLKELLWLSDFKLSPPRRNQNKTVVNSIPDYTSYVHSRKHSSIQNGHCWSISLDFFKNNSFNLIELYDKLKVIRECGIVNFIPSSKWEVLNSVDHNNINHDCILQLNELLYSDKTDEWLLLLGKSLFLHRYEDILNNILNDYILVNFLKNSDFPKILKIFNNQDLSSFEKYNFENPYLFHPTISLLCREYWGMTSFSKERSNDTFLYQSEKKMKNFIDVADERQLILEEILASILPIELVQSAYHAVSHNLFNLLAERRLSHSNRGGPMTCDVGDIVLIEEPAKLTTRDAQELLKNKVKMPFLYKVTLRDTLRANDAKKQLVPELYKRMEKSLNKRLERLEKNRHTMHKFKHTNIYQHEKVKKSLDVEHRPFCADLYLTGGDVVLPLIGTDVILPSDSGERQIVNDFFYSPFPQMKREPIAVCDYDEQAFVSPKKSNFTRNSETGEIEVNTIINGEADQNKFRRNLFNFFNLSLQVNLGNLQRRLNVNNRKMTDYMKKNTISSGEDNRSIHLNNSHIISNYLTPPKDKNMTNFNITGSYRFLLYPVSNLTFDVVDAQNKEILNQINSVNDILEFEEQILPNQQSSSESEFAISQGRRKNHQYMKMMDHIKEIQKSNKTELTEKEEDHHYFKNYVLSDLERNKIVSSTDFRKAFGFGKDMYTEHTTMKHRRSQKVFNRTIYPVGRVRIRLNVDERFDCDVPGGILRELS